MEIKPIVPVYSSQNYDTHDIDSLAVTSISDSQWLVFVTAKRGKSVMVFDFLTGALQNEIRPMREDGKPVFQRPNGIAIHKNIVYVTDRDNEYVVKMSVSGEILGLLSLDGISLPYGIYVRPLDPPVVYVTGSALHSHSPDRINVSKDGNADYRIFGDIKGRGVLQRAESLWGDTKTNQLLVADEIEKTIKIYDLSTGAFRGVIGHGLFSGEPEGICLYESDTPQRRMWICADQNKLAPDEAVRRAPYPVKYEDINRFHVFCATHLDYLGTFSITSVSNTDGICCVSQPISDRFPKGALLVVNNDQSFVVVDMQDVLSTIY